MFRQSLSRKTVILNCSLCQVPISCFSVCQTIILTAVEHLLQCKHHCLFTVSLQFTRTLYFYHVLLCSLIVFTVDVPFLQNGYKQSQKKGLYEHFIHNQFELLCKIHDITFVSSCEGIQLCRVCNPWKCACVL